MTMFGRGQSPGQGAHNRTSGNGASAKGNGASASHDDWQSRSRVFLTPVAPPSILGLFGFFGATIMVGTHMAGCFGRAPFLSHCSSATRP